MFESGKEYDFDYDSQIIQHEKYDARRIYKKTAGYFPGMPTQDTKSYMLKIGTVMPMLKHPGTRHCKEYTNCGKQMAMIKNSYNYIVNKASCIFKDIKPTSRIKRFIFRFISVAGQWVYQHRQ
jgi:hypothetical protein